MQHCVQTLASRFDATLTGPSGCSEFARSARNSSFDLVLGGSGLVGSVTWFLEKIAKARSAVHVHGLAEFLESAWSKIVARVPNAMLLVASGTPTVAFPVGGVVDAAADDVDGLLVPEGDYETFADAVLSICQGGPPSRSSCRNHAEKFSWEAHGQKSLAALDFSAGPSF